MPDPETANTDSPPKRYRFADLVLDSGRRRVSRAGETIALSRLSYEFLRVLVEAAPNLVTHDEMARRAWGPRRTVTPENLTQRLLMLRHSLGDDALTPRYIETVRSQGCRLIADVELVSPESASGNRRADASLQRRHAALYIGTAGVIVAALLAISGITPTSREPAAVTLATVSATTSAPSSIGSEIPPNSIAVLRFEQLNPETDEASYFADAMHAELINELGRSPDVYVIARASMHQYAGAGVPLRDMADQLRVSLVIAGSIRYLQDRIHVIAELLRADSGVQIWSKNYDARPDDLFTVERDIAISVARAISADIPTVGTRNRKDIPTTLEAFAFFMRAMDAFNQPVPGSRTTAHMLLDEAITLDAEFALAYAGKALVETYTIINSNDLDENTATSVEAREQVVRDFAAKALTLEPDTDLAYYALGMLDLFSWRWADAHQQFERALELTPQHAVFLAQMAWLEVCGMDMPEGLRLAARGIALDPRNPFVHQLYSDVLDCTGDSAAALAATEHALAVETTSFANRMNHAFRAGRVHGQEAGVAELARLEPLLTNQRILSMPAVALAYRRLGQPEDARRLYDRFATLTASQRIGPANWYLAYLAIDDYDSAYLKLKEAVDHSGPGPGFYTLVAFMRNDGTTAPFDEPRFLELRDALRAGRGL